MTFNRGRYLIAWLDASQGNSIGQKVFNDVLE